jgi:hypothetical protein
MKKENHSKFQEMFELLKNKLAVLVWVITAILPLLLNPLYDLLISENQEEFGLLGVYSIFLISTVTVFLCFCVVHNFYSQKAKIGDLKNGIEDNHSSLNKTYCNNGIDLNCCIEQCKELLLAENDLLKAMGIIDLHGLSKIESTLPINAVWILSSNLSDELNDELFKNIVVDNIKRGVAYTYFHSNKEGENLKAKKLKSKFEDSIFCTSIDDKKYKLLFSFIDIVIFDPLSEQTVAYVGIAKNVLLGNVLYIKLDDNTTAAMLEILIEENKKNLV